MLLKESSESYTNLALLLRSRYLDVLDVSVYSSITVNGWASSLDRF
jgi:hypothetical protein